MIPYAHTYDQHRWHSLARERNLKGPETKGHDIRYFDADGKVAALWNGTRRFGWVLPSVNDHG